MDTFVRRHAENVRGVLSGFDRVRFRGTLRLLSHVGGMMNFLWQKRVLLKEFKGYVLSVTDRVRRMTEAAAKAAGGSVIYLSSCSASKEVIARRIEEEKGIRQGLICILSSVEPCFSYEVHRNRETRKLDLRGGRRKCLHYYHYYRHERLGFMHVRTQTWFPFAVHICVNGREWLARQMDETGIPYRRKNNCFMDIGDVDRGQKLLDDQLRTDWAELLTGLALRSNPAHEDIFRDCPVPYYWSIEESEWATDVMFRSPEALGRLYPRLIRHGIETLSSRDVMRFLGRKVPEQRGINGRFKGEVVSELRERPEGMRIKHQLNRNAIKMYDKEGSVLRVETTINDARDMKAYRPKEGDPEGEKSWRYLRKGVADTHRRAEISEAANKRYLETMAAVDGKTAMGDLAEGIAKAVQWKGRRVRALNPLGAADAALLRAVARGEFAINGFRNRDLVELLYDAKANTKTEARRRSSAVTRKVRLLRAHGLIRKVPKTYRYVLTKIGAKTITALIMATAADTAKLSAAG